MKYDSLFTEIGVDIEKIPSNDFRIKENKYKNKLSSGKKLEPIKGHEL